MVTTVDLPENPDDVQEDPRESRKMDPELKAIGAIMRIIDELEKEAKSRVIAYLADRYQAPLQQPF